MISSHFRCDWCETTLPAERDTNAEEQLALEADWLLLNRGWNDENEEPDEKLDFCSPECLLRWVFTEHIDAGELAEMLKERPVKRKPGEKRNKQGS